MKPEVMSVKEFCSLARISVVTVYALWKRGEGPRSIRIGRRRLINRETALAWLKERESDGGVAA